MRYSLNSLCYRFSDFHSISELDNIQMLYESNLRLKETPLDSFEKPQDKKNDHQMKPHKNICWHISFLDKNSKKSILLPHDSNKHSYKALSN